MIEPEQVFITALSKIVPTATLEGALSLSNPVTYNYRACSGLSVCMYILFPRTLSRVLAIIN